MPWDERDEEGQGGSFEYTFTINTAKAGFTDYNEGRTCLLILDGEAEFDNGKVLDKHMWINASEGWTATEDGRYFSKPDDPDARFDKRSKIQQFIKSAIDAGVPIKERSESSLDTAGWAGLKVRIREEERSFKGREGDTITFTQPLVVEYLGEADSSSVKPALKSVKGTKAAATNGSSDAELIEKARAIAKEEPDLISYMDRASRELGVELDHQLCSASFFEKANA